VSSVDKELQNACFELAGTTKWVQKPIDAEGLHTFDGRLVEISKRSSASRLISTFFSLPELSAT
jgi:hypothetical protein